MAARANKFSAKSVVTEAGRFSSTGEHRRWCELELLAKAGVISDLSRQPKFPFFIGSKPVLMRSEGYPNGRQVVYTADFKYVENGIPVTEEFKGLDDTASRLRRAIVEAMYGITIRVTRAPSSRKRRSA
jgi:hypothetical protein